MSNREPHIQPPQLIPPNPVHLLQDEIKTMLHAGDEVRSCMGALERVGLNLVGEMLKGQGDFVELEHYPRDDVFDNETFGQYYYHAHRSDIQEHGHFHTFLRTGGRAWPAEPLDYPLTSEPWPQGQDAIAHLAGISMDAWGRPIGLFAANRWVTGETWYSARDVIEMLPQFAIEHAWPSWPVNRWISAMLRLFRPHIQALLLHRDQMMEYWQQRHPGQDVLEDRNLELTGYLPISIDHWIASLEQVQRG
ncbi:DUF6969 family protein [Sedimenticola thiotaurini]|nr:hypothetical protein [Sedimenticola thiotaurini]